MHIRPLELADLPRVADLSAAAMLDDELFDHICPGRREFYSDFRELFLRARKQRYYSPGYVFRLAVTDAGDCDPRDEGKVVGCALWERTGDDPAAEKWTSPNSGWGSWLELSLLNLEDKYYKIFRPNRSLDYGRLAEFDAAAESSFPKEVFPQLWHLASLAVDPAYQRRGVGRMLVNWGLEQCRVESVPAGLEASAAGSQLYEKMGFRVLRQLEWRKGNFAPVMVWDSSGEEGEGSWYEKVKKAVDTQKS